jgi:molybdopterin-guanine dinucleotide biosynthesis protein A
VELNRHGLTAVVLAGGPHDAVAALAPGAPNKSFVPVDGRPLVARTIAALRTSPRIARILVVAPFVPSALAELWTADEIRRDGKTISDSLRSGLRGLPADELVLVTAADLPILSRTAIDEFIDAALAAEADLVYACVERRVHEARFPAVPHTWARLRDGSFCGGGCVALRPRLLGALEGFLERLGAARKNPLQLASIFGSQTLVRYALGALTIAEAERRAGELLGARARAVVCSHAEIAVNVDRVGDVALAEQLVAAERAISSA